MTIGEFYLNKQTNTPSLPDHPKEMEIEPEKQGLTCWLPVFAGMGPDYSLQSTGPAY